MEKGKKTIYRFRLRLKRNVFLVASILAGVVTGCSSYTASIEKSEQSTYLSEKAVSHNSSSSSLEPNPVSCLGGAILPPEEPRLETILEIDLTQEEGEPAFLEFYTISADELVGQKGGRTKLAKNLKVDDFVTMYSGKVGRISSVRTALFTPRVVFVNNKKQGSRRVLAKSKRWTNAILNIYTPTDTIETTPEHPFYVNEKWIEAKYLKSGDQIASVKSKPIFVIKTETVDLGKGGKFVYNLKVEGAENFYVGEEGLLSHNCTDVTCANCAPALSLKVGRLQDPIPSKHLKITTIDNLNAGTANLSSGEYTYIVMQDNSVRLFDSVLEQSDPNYVFGHTSLLTPEVRGRIVKDFDDSTVVWAGNLEYRDNDGLTSWNNNSGHFMPDDDIYDKVGLDESKYIGEEF